MGIVWQVEKSFVPHSSRTVPMPALSGFEQQQRRVIKKDKGATTNEQGTTKFAHHSTQSQSKLDAPLPLSNCGEVLCE